MFLKALASYKNTAAAPTVYTIVVSFCVMILAAVALTAITFTEDSFFLFPVAFIFAGSLVAVFVSALWFLFNYDN